MILFHAWVISAQQRNETAADVRAMIANGTFTGFQSRAEREAAKAVRNYKYKADGSIDWGEYLKRKPKRDGGTESGS